MGPNGQNIEKRHQFDPKTVQTNGQKVEVGSRCSRQMIKKKTHRESLDSFSGDCERCTTFCKVNFIIKSGDFAINFEAWKKDIKK
jgi:hypothetical protein